MKNHKDLVNRSEERLKNVNHYANKAGKRNVQTRIDNQGTDLRIKKRNPNSWMNRYLSKGTVATKAS